ncbi:sugar transferase [Natrialbaceae archaeon A-CW3]
MGIVLSPLSQPRPRRTTTMLRMTVKRVLVACLALVALGVVGVPGMPTPVTVGALGIVLVSLVPLWVWFLRRQTGSKRVLVVGDDPSRLTATIRSLQTEPIGFLSPVLTEQQLGLGHSSQGESARAEHEGSLEQIAATDGGVMQAKPIRALSGVERLSGLSRLEHVIHERDVDTVALAFSEADREECFGALRVCHETGVDVLAHSGLESTLPVRERMENGLVAVDLEPWPWYSRVAKRLFDIVFATVGLLVLSPLILAISVAIKIDSPGPVFYGQRRTAELGQTFQVWKFRSMLPESEDARPGDDHDRITRMGRVLRKTHMDEIPQLWAILVGHMSVVGPRAAWVDEEAVLEREIHGWSKRWTVTPGLTGLAQIRNVDSTNGQRKLEYDLEYVRRQSLWFDISIVFQQVWNIIKDIWVMVCP